MGSSEEENGEEGDQSFEALEPELLTTEEENLEGQGVAPEGSGAKEKREREKKVLFYGVKEGIDKRSKNGCRFFSRKGYRLYNPKQGYWTLLNHEQVREYILKTITMTPGLRSVGRLHEPSFWSNFMTWYETLCKSCLPAHSKWLVAFRDGTVDTLNLIIKPHNKFLFCYRSVPTEYKGGNLSDKAMQFFIELAGADGTNREIEYFQGGLLTSLN